MECSLCQLPLIKGSLFEKGLSFCCPGCLSVWRILEAKKELEGAKEHPLVREAARRGIISNPNLIQELSEKREGTAFRFTFEIVDLFCPSCQDLIEWVLQKERGVKSALVDYSTDLAVVEYLPSRIGKEELLQLVSSLGYTPRLLDTIEKQESRTSKMRLGIASFCALNVMMFSYPLLISLFDESAGEWGPFFAWLSLLFTLPVATYGAWPIYKRAFHGVKRGFLGMELLATLAILCALGLSTWNLLHGSMHVYFDAASALVALLLLGRFLEQRAKFKTKETLLEMHRSMPKKARRRHSSGEVEYVPIKSIAVGESIKVLQGEKLPLDGVVLDGEALIDESMLTGEAMPLLKKVGDRLSSGTLVTKGWLVYRVTSDEKGSTLAQIVGQVECGFKRKSRYRRAFDPVVSAFIPLLLLLGASLLLVMPNKEGLYRLLTLLLIACPCAIGVAAPLAESSLISALLSMGLIVRNRGALADLGREDLFIFDKTGTITEGRFQALSPIKTWPERALLKSLCSFSNHPVAVSIARELEDEASLALDEVQEHIGRGIEAKYAGKSCYVGSRRWFEELNIEEIPPISGCVELLFFCGDVKVIRLLDSVRSGAKELIAHLNVESWLLSGDQPHLVEKLGAELGFSKAFGGRSPLEKQQIVDAERKRGRIVAMVGDGINDAPALSASSLSFAQVGATDLSLQTSDFLITAHSLTLLSDARTLGQRGRRIVHQNLFWASIYNLFGIFLALLGLLHPLFSTLAMTASSLIVLLNSRRLR